MQIAFPIRSDQKNAINFSGIETRINRHSGSVLAFITVLYFAITISLASIKLLWFDEFITFYIAKLNSIRAIWTALGSGADPNPPLTHILSMGSMRLFGASALAFRLPAIIAGWVCVLCLFLFLRRRVPVLYAAVAVCLFMATAAFDYSYEARSYALTLAFSSASLLAWQRTVEAKRSILAPILLALTLGAGLSSNYFAILAFFPITAGQLVHDVQNRSVQWRVWVAIFTGALPFFIYLPLINHAIAKFTPYAWNKVEFGATADSYLEMVETVLWVALALLAGALVLWFRQKQRSQRTRPVLPLHEAVAVFVLMLYPFVAYLIARVRGGMLSPRFVLPVASGIALAAGIAAYRLFARRPAFGLALLALLLAWVFAREGVVAYRYHEQRLALYRVIERLPSAERIVVSDSLLVLPLHWYAPEKIASRIVFPVDFAAIRKYKKEDSPEQNLWAGRSGIFPLPIVPLSAIKDELPNSLIVATRGNWLVSTMRERGLPLYELPIFTDTGDITGFTPLSHGPVVYYSSLPTEPDSVAKQERMQTQTGFHNGTHAKQP